MFRNLQITEMKIKNSNNFTALTLDELFFFKYSQTFPGGHLY
jgi:hypothetical protein